jgi:hypothetical protein
MLDLLIDEIGRSMEGLDLMGLGSLASHVKFPKDTLPEQQV